MAQVKEDMSDRSDLEPIWVVKPGNSEQLVETEKELLMRSVTLKHVLQDTQADLKRPMKDGKEERRLTEEERRQIIPVTEVNLDVFEKILEWCKHHRNDPPATEDDDSDSRKKSTDIDDWDQKFMQVDQEMLFKIIMGANYLDIKPLLDIGCKTVANMIKGKSPEEIRKTFNIQNDFTPEEEDQIRRENEWAEDR